MSETNPVKDALAEFGGRAGLVRKGSRWYQVADEVIVVVEPQRSQYGPQWYVNVGIGLTSLLATDRPTADACGIEERLDGLAVARDGKEASARIRTLLDLEAERDEAERAADLVEALERYVGPVLEGARTVDGVRALVDGEGPLHKAWIKGAATEALHGPRPVVEPPPVTDASPEVRFTTEKIGPDGEPQGTVQVQQPDGTFTTWGGLARRADTVAFAANGGYAFVEDPAD